MVKKLLAVAVLATVAFWGWKWLESDSQKIKKELQSLAKALSYDTAPRGIEVMGRARQIADYFAPEVIVTLQFSHRQNVELVNRAEILEKSLFMFKAMPSLKVEFVDINIKRVEGMTAMVETTMKLHLSSDANPPEAIEVHLQMRKDKRWMIDGLKTVEAINL